MQTILDQNYTAFYSIFKLEKYKIRSINCALNLTLYRSYRFIINKNRGSLRRQSRNNLKKRKKGFQQCLCYPYSRISLSCYLHSTWVFCDDSWVSSQRAKLIELVLIVSNVVRLDLLSTSIEGELGIHLSSSNFECLRQRSTLDCVNRLKW